MKQLMALFLSLIAVSFFSEEIKYPFDESTFKNWKVLSDGYSASDATPDLSLKKYPMPWIMEPKVADEERAVFFLSLPYSNPSDPPIYILQPLVPVEFKEIRGMKMIYLYLYGYRYRIKAGILFEDRNHQSYELIIPQTLDFDGWKKLEIHVKNNFSVEGFILKGIVFYLPDSSLISDYANEMQVRIGELRIEY